MKKPTAVALSVLALALALAPFAFAHDHGKPGKTKGSWKGEIVDMACYLPHAAKGADHADCAKKCAKAGEPIGLLLADGDLVLLMADHDDGQPFEAAKELAGSMVEVTGTMAERDGTKAITVTGVKTAG